MKTGKESCATITGIVLPAAWDEEGNVTGLAIQTAAEEEYLIADTGKGRQLMAFIHRNLQLSGSLHEGLDGRRIINIHSFRLAASFS